MYRVSVALALLLAPLPAQAQHWVRVWSDEGSRSYLDIDSMRKEGDLITATTISTMIKPVQGAETIRWMIFTIEYRCSDRMGHFVHATALDAARATVFDLDDPDQGKYRPALNSDAAATMNYVCGIDRDKAVPVADPYTDALPKGDK